MLRQILVVIKQKSETRIFKEYVEMMGEIGKKAKSPEMAYYDALSGLLRDVGKRMVPNVQNVREQVIEGRKPDYSLYSSSLENELGDTSRHKVMQPDRGVVEVKSISVPLNQLHDLRQVNDYIDLFETVIITNYREFALLVKKDDGSSIEINRCSLADSEKNFIKLNELPEDKQTSLAKDLVAFLQTAMSHTVPYKKCKDVANFLAQYARQAQERLKRSKKAVKKMEDLKKSLEALYGKKFEGEIDYSLFISAIIQTLFYGLFLAWITSPDDEEFRWETAWKNLDLEIMRAIYKKSMDIDVIETIIKAAEMKLNDSNKKAVKEEFENAEDAIQFFYEPFLTEYDKDLKKALGVWYTPRDIAKFQIRKVDQVLKQEFPDKPLGLADPNVYVIDPCCGTGVYLTELIKFVAEAITKNALFKEKLMKFVSKRMKGFEIMTAPFVIANWQVRKLLQEYGIELDLASDEERPVLLTNSLFGWSNTDVEEPLIFSEMENERKLAKKIKQEEPIFVIIGNPPYNSYVLSEENTKHLREEYWNIAKSKPWNVKGRPGTSDLYANFFRVAENKIEKLGRGVLCYISSDTYLKKKSFVGMRQHLLKTFDKIWIDYLHGEYTDKYRDEDGKRRESIFYTTPGTGIKLGTAIGTYVKSPATDEKKLTELVHYREDADCSIAERRRKKLLETLHSDGYTGVDVSIARNKDRYIAFHPIKIGSDYEKWPALNELWLDAPFPGLDETRAGALYDFNKHELEERVSKYLNSSFEDLVNETGKLEGLWRTKKYFLHPSKVHEKARDAKKENQLWIDFLARPFDDQHAFVIPSIKLWNRDRSKILRSFIIAGMPKLVLREKISHSESGPPMFFTRSCGSWFCVTGGNPYYLPFYSCDQSVLEIGEASPNLSDKANEYLNDICTKQNNITDHSEIYLHCLAISYAPEYYNNNDEALKTYYPRIPLPNDEAILEKSINLGRMVQDILDTKSYGYESIFNMACKKMKAIIGEIGGKGDFELTAKWGTGGNGKKVMPGKGRIKSCRTSKAHMKTLLEIFKDVKFDQKKITDLFSDMYKIYLNDNTYWGCVPEVAWNFTQGGYQVLPKWLSYRSHKVIDRKLLSEEIEEFQDKIIRLTLLSVLQLDLDDNYNEVIKDTYDWKQ